MNSLHMTGTNQTGSIYGTVLFDDAPLPGVTVTLTGAGLGPLTAVTDAQGRFRFPNLDTGSVNIQAELEGFSPRSYPGVRVDVRRTMEMQIAMNPAEE